MTCAPTRFAIAAVAVVLVTASCRSYRREPVTPWLQEVRWENETIIAESGRGRGTYLELSDERGNVVRVEGWGCRAIDFGRAALCQGSTADMRGRAFLLRRSGERRVVGCPDAPDGTVTKLTESEVVCTQHRYEPSYVEIRTRMDLDGRVIE